MTNYNKIINLALTLVKHCLILQSRQLISLRMISCEIRFYSISDEIIIITEDLIVIRIISVSLRQRNSGKMSKGRTTIC